MFYLKEIDIFSPKRVFFFCFLLNLCIPIYAQNIDENFLNSLPESLKSELNIGQIPDSQINQKDYESFDSSLQKEPTISDGELEIFGSSFFSTYSSTFMPINDPAASSNYILDVDDVIFIQYLGDSNQSFDLRIDRSGSIVLPEVGKINFAGLTINQANEKLNSALSSVLLNTNAILTLREVRDINVLVTGFVENPGIYVVSGYSNIIHVLNSAGGIAKNGSYRNVIIKRKGEVVHQLDLYDIFVSGDTTSNISLRSGDSIIIEPSNNFIPLVGALNREGIYEFRDGETVSEIINIAGGISNKANKEKEFLLIREAKDSLEMISGVMNSTNKITLFSNDRIFVKYRDYNSDELFLSEFEDFIDDPVIVTGAVNFPGEYFISQNLTLAELINDFGGFKQDAYVFGAALFNEDAKELEREFNSRLYNDAIKSLANIGSLSRTDNLSSLPSLLQEFKEIDPQGRIVTEFSLEEIRSNPSLNYKLSPGDRIHVPYFKKIIYVFGEVLNPGTQIFDESFSITEYVEKSGGLNEYADNSSIIIVHPNGESERIRLRKFAKNNNTSLYAGSVIYVPRDLKQIDGIELGSVLAPIMSGLAISLASLNSISNN